MLVTHYEAILGELLADGHDLPGALQDLLHDKVVALQTQALGLGVGELLLALRCCQQSQVDSATVLCDQDKAVILTL